MPSLGDLVQLTTSAGPWYALALVLLVIAAGIARQQRTSARSQGERIGRLEQLFRSERLRRQQVESVLIGLGVDLPWWPPDGPQQPRSARLRPPALDDDQDDADEQPHTEAVERIPVPPLPPEVGARHRRGPRNQGDY